MRNVRAEEEIQGELRGAGIPPLWRDHGTAVLGLQSCLFSACLEG